EPDRRDAENSSAQGRSEIARRRRRAGDCDHPRASPRQPRTAAESGRRMRNCWVTVQSEESSLVRLPSPLRGRVGERGKPRTPADEMRRQAINVLRETIDDDASAVLAMRRALAQAAPLSLTLPRKGGGNPSAGACLTCAGWVQ